MIFDSLAVFLLSYILSYIHLVPSATCASRYLRKTKKKLNCILFKQVLLRKLNYWKILATGKMIYSWP